MHITINENENGTRTFKVSLGGLELKQRLRVQRDIERRFAQVTSTSLSYRTGILEVTVNLGQLSGRDLENAAGVLSAKIKGITKSRMQKAALVL